VKTQAQYETDIPAIARVWMGLVDARVAAGWTPEFAFDDASNRAAKVGTDDEATIQMMTRAAAHIAYPPSSELGWPHRNAFVAWWNARFDDAPRLDDYDFAAPCLLEVGDQTAAIIATWSGYREYMAPERAQA
jgi:hypothetical protein